MPEARDPGWLLRFHVELKPLSAAKIAAKARRSERWARCRASPRGHDYRVKRTFANGWRNEVCRKCGFGRCRQVGGKEKKGK